MCANNVKNKSAAVKWTKKFLISSRNSQTRESVLLGLETESQTSRPAYIIIFIWFGLHRNIVNMDRSRDLDNEVDFSVVPIVNANAAIFPSAKNQGSAGISELIFVPAGSTTGQPFGDTGTNHPSGIIVGHGADHVFVHEKTVGRCGLKISV